MAWAVPLAFTAVKTYLDQKNATENDAAARQAGAAKLAAMRQGAGQMAAYRQSLTPQMLAAMGQQMNAYGGARNTLMQMYGGHQAPPGQMMTPGATTGGQMPSVRGRLDQILGAPQTGLQAPQGPIPFPAQTRAGNLQGLMPGGIQMGFGGEGTSGGLPMPSQLIGRGMP